MQYKLVKSSQMYLSYCISVYQYLFHCNVCHGTSAPIITVVKSALLIFLFFSTQQNCLQMDQKPHCIVHKDDYFHNENNYNTMYEQ